MSVVLDYFVAGSAHGCGVGEQKGRFQVVLPCLAAGDHVFASYPCLDATPMAFHIPTLHLAALRVTPAETRLTVYRRP